MELGAQVSPAHVLLTGIQIFLLPVLILGCGKLGEGWAELVQEVDARGAGGHVLIQNVSW